MIQGASSQARVLGNSMAQLTMAWRHVWLSQSGLSDVDKAAVLEAAITPGDVFGPKAEAALDEAQKVRLRIQSIHRHGQSRSGPTKQTSESAPFQDAQVGRIVSSHKAGQLVHNSGPSRRLFSYPHQSRSQEVPQVLLSYSTRSFPLVCPFHHELSQSAWMLLLFR